jgi:predicted Zn-dependent protease
MQPRARSVPRPGWLLPLGISAAVAGCITLGWWLGRHSAPDAADPARRALERQLEQLQERTRGGQLSDADQQRLLELLLALGQDKAAIPLLEGMADQHPQRWPLRLLLAELRRNGNDRNGAEQELLRLLSLQPERIEALQLLALVQLEQGRGGAAQVRLKGLLESKLKPTARPEAVPIGLLLADLQQRQGQAGEAAALYGRLANEFGKDPRPLLALALLRQEQGNTQAAQEALAQARSRMGEASGVRLDQVASGWGVSSLRRNAFRAPSPKGSPGPAPQVSAPPTP